MLLKQLKYFTEVITCQSFTDAAEKCGISQSAMSQQIRALEENLDTELIRRKNRKFYMTPAGEYFYRHGLVLLDEAERLKKETARIGRQINQRLRVGYSKYLHGTELCRAAALLSEKYPMMELETAAGYAEELIDMLCFGGTDIILCSPRPGDLQDFEYISLTKGRYFIEISERSPLSALDYVNIEELRRIPCIIAVPADQRERQRDNCVNMLGLQDLGQRISAYGRNGGKAGTGRYPTSPHSALRRWKAIKKGIYCLLEERPGRRICQGICRNTSERI